MSVLTELPLLVSLAWLAGQTSLAQPAPASAQPACVEAAIELVDGRAGARVDTIQVVLADGEGGAGAARVEVTAGPFRRVLNLTGGGPRVLRFDPPLPGTDLTVSLEPDFGVPGRVCVERIELLADGQQVAAI